MLRETFQAIPVRSCNHGFFCLFQIDRKHQRHFWVARGHGTGITNIPRYGHPLPLPYPALHIFLVGICLDESPRFVTRAPTYFFIVERQPTWKPPRFCPNHTSP
jgi:hypothetical protein